MKHNIKTKSFFRCFSNNKNALTLTELLVASILIGIVVTGVGVFSITIKRIEDSTSKATILATETTAVMSDMTRNASLAIGWQGNPGIVVNGTSWIAFRQDQNASPTPGVYTDDTWVIYVHSSNTLTVCEMLAASPPDPAACVGSTITLTKKLLSKTFTFVTNSAMPDPEFYVNLIITTRDDPTKAEDPIKNPEYSMRTKVSPPSHSW